MPQYLISVYQPDGGVPDAETMARIAAGLHWLNEELRESGSWVFTGDKISISLGIEAVLQK